jgi:hypothetical protein
VPRFDRTLGDVSTPPIDVNFVQISTSRSHVIPRILKALATLLIEASWKILADGLQVAAIRVSESRISFDDAKLWTKNTYVKRLPGQFVGSHSNDHRRIVTHPAACPNVDTTPGRFQLVQAPKLREQLRIVEQLRREKRGGRDEAIPDAKRKVKGLQCSISTFRQGKKAREPWPGESTTHN